MDLSGDVVEQSSFDVSFFRGGIEEFGRDVQDFGDVGESESDGSESRRGGQIAGEVHKSFRDIADCYLNRLPWICG